MIRVRHLPGGRRLPLLGKEPHDAGHDPPQIIKNRPALPLAWRVSGGLVILALISIAWYFRHSDFLQHPATVADHPYSAGIRFFVLYIAAAAAALPTLPVNLAAGWLWGPVVGGLISGIGAASGAVLAFAAARTLFGQPLRRRFDSRFLVWVQQEFEAKGWRFIAFVRINPVFPSGPLNYLFGLTSIKTGTYVWATMVFLLLPSTIIAWMGSAAAHVHTGSDFTQIIRAVIAISAGITLMFGIRYAARYLNYAKSGSRQ